MKRPFNLSICIVVFLLFAPFASAQSLSKYRNFALGSSLVDLSAQVNAKPADATVTHPAPALIQELTWWPVKSYDTVAAADAVQLGVFSFYNGHLFKIVVTYENSATQGLSPEDMTRVFSVQYGPATLPVAATNPPAGGAYNSSAKTVALWEDSQYSVVLSRFPLSSIFELVVTSKQLSAQADAAIAQAAQQARDDAPQLEIARVKQQAEDQEALRQTNLKAFRP